MTTEPDQIRATPEQIERAKNMIQYARAVECALRGDAVDSLPECADISNAIVFAPALMIAESLSYLSLETNRIGACLDSIIAIIRNRL